MSRVSAFRGTFDSTKRPYVVLTPDSFVSIQGETTVITCGECNKRINLNRYITSINSEASVDSPPGSATITLAIPDNDVNSFFVDGQFVVIPMMEIEIFSKGYFLIGGFPQYYRTFWGIVSSVSKHWASGTTTVTLSCKDILRWWELTQITLNPAFLAPEGSSAGNYQIYQNQFAGANPYTVIITLAREAMGDFSITTGSFTSSKPEAGSENEAIGSYAKDIMAYWQLKFGNIWNNLVLYGTSGQAYTFAGDPGNVSPLQITKQIFDAESQNLNLNPQSALFKINQNEIAAFKISIDRAGDVEFLQTENQTKLAVAMTARDQAGNEFYCDTTGDIIFKPPFYNLNVIPNKPVSWIQDFEIIEDNISDTEQEVYTHVTASGNAFGGKIDWGLNDEFTTPRTGIIDFHLLRRYGWRRTELSLEWAGNPRKLFYHLLDWMDRINSKRQNGTITIPLRPELRMGFPIWIPKYDSFFYVEAISHSFSPGGQATTTLTLTAKRSKFIAPKNIGQISATGSRSVTPTNTQNGKTKGPPITETTYKVTFPSDIGGTVENQQGQVENNAPAILRDQKTGQLLGYPNAVMVYRKSLSGQILARILSNTGSKKSHQPTKQDRKTNGGTRYTYNSTVANVFTLLQNASRAKTVERLRLHRYESGMSNAGLYDYAQDVNASFKEFSVVPADAIVWGTGTQDPNQDVDLAGIQSSGGQGAVVFSDPKARQASIKATINSLNDQLKTAIGIFNQKNTIYKNAAATYNTYLKSKYGGGSAPNNNQLDTEDSEQKLLMDNALTDKNTAASNVTNLQNQIAQEKKGLGTIKKLKSLNVMIRPVSDEFGFEVIGHYRYGRGAFIDKGQVKILNPNNNVGISNPISIQFAATGGFLTSNPIINNLGPSSQTFAQAFEEMAPDDYKTGASFTGGNYGTSQIDTSTINYTNQQTYSDAINHQAVDTGKAIFAEADATRRAKTLAEMSPTFSNGLDEVSFNRCACVLGRSNWLSVLPQSFIDQVLNPASASASSQASLDANNISPGNLSVQGSPFLSLIPENQTNILTAQSDNFNLNPGAGGFFNVLHNFLVQRFDADYQENSKREQFDVSGGQSIQAPSPLEESNILPTPGDTLFNRAAQGDPNALKALQSGANFNFGLSAAAVSKFNEQASAASNQLKNATSQIPGSTAGAISNIISSPPGTVTTAPVQKPQIVVPANPTIGNLLNPRANNYSSPYIDYSDINTGVGKTPGNSS